jgi:hypothetical protein
MSLGIDNWYLLQPTASPLPCHDINPDGIHRHIPASH